MSQRREEEHTPEQDAEFMLSVIHTLVVRVHQLEQRAKEPPSTPTTYYNDPAPVEKVAPLTLKVAELEKQSHL